MSEIPQNSQTQSKEKDFKFKRVTNKSANINQNKIEELEKYKQEILLRKMLMDKAPPFVTAKSWAIFDNTQQKFMFGKFESDR